MESGAYEGLGLSSVAFLQRYRTGTSDPIHDFYRPSLQNSACYDRAVGYFRSSIYLIVGHDTIEFAKRGGRIRLVCSPSLHPADTASIEAGYRGRELDMGSALEDELEDLLSQPETNYRTRVLATLVATGALDIKIAVRPKSYGLYHEKIGIFRDRFKNALSFIGSANETWNGWDPAGNFESIEAFCSWKGLAEAGRVQRHTDDFEALWNKVAPDVSVEDFPEAVRRRLIQETLPSLSAIEADLLEDSIPRGMTNPKRAPLPHQTAAIQAWELAGKKGVLQHATGSGKTFTAISAMRSHLALGLPVLILVPSSLLLSQWSVEIAAEMPDAARMLAGAGHNSWRQGTRLTSISSDDCNLGPRVIIATMQTAATDTFQSGLCQGPHLMLVADEVHQIGSSFNAKSLSLQTGPKLGLSATPERYGDSEGTARIFGYFGPILPPAITLRDAIAAGRLVEYQYFPHPVRLSADEAEEWRELSKAISREVGRSQSPDGSRYLSDRAKLLLIRRSRIAKKAGNKIALAVEILSAEFEEGARWLVYCEDLEQLSEVRSALSSAGLSSTEYHSNMLGDKSGTLDWFKTFGGILVSIRCLDEGVDIPAISHALVLASSQNPRQFIQRRGRVLRSISGKTLAVIHDAIVVPVSVEDEPEQLALLRSEFVRALEFAGDAFNGGADAELRAIAAEIGFDPDENSQDGVEDEDSEDDRS